MARFLVRREKQLSGQGYCSVPVSSIHFLVKTQNPSSPLRFYSPSREDICAQPLSISAAGYPRRPLALYTVECSAVMNIYMCIYMCVNEYIAYLILFKLVHLSAIKQILMSLSPQDLAA